MSTVGVGLLAYLVGVAVSIVVVAANDVEESQAVCSAMLWPLVVPLMMAEFAFNVLYELGRRFR